tara:strand:- start:551 stop:844 length:294 start_codon:yes stop_codon:yes gene_type:complete
MTPKNRKRESMTDKTIIKKIREMLETNTMVNWGSADYTPEEEFQNMIDELDKMIAEQKSMTDKTIKIYVEGGCVTEVTNLPDDFDYQIIDSDVQEEE